jgi:hypothetical protein
LLDEGQRSAIFARFDASLWIRGFLSIGTIAAPLLRPRS